MYAQLGDIVYQALVGFQTFDQVKEESYAEHPLINGKPRLQKIGSKLDTVSLGIRLHKMFTDPDVELNKLEQYRKNGEILALIMGDGRIIGDFVINSMTISHKQMTPDGGILLVELTLDLKEYFSPDRDAAASNAAVNNGFANSQNTPPVTNPVNIPGTSAISASNSLVSCGSGMGAVSDIGNQLGVNSALLKTQCEQMKTKVLKALNDVTKIISLIDADSGSQLYAVTRDLSNSCSVMVTNLTDLVNDIAQLISDITGNPINVPAGIVTVGSDISTAMDQLDQIKQNAAAMAAMAALKQ